MHARQQIRDQVVTTLRTTATAGSNVNVQDPYAKTTLPNITVMTGSETVPELDGTLGTTQFREVELVVEIRHTLATGLQNLVDLVAAEVEAALYVDQTLSGLAKTLEYEGAEFEIEEGDTKVGLLSLVFSVLYRIDATDPETIIQ